MTRAAPILWDVFEEHLDEAAFLWSQWEKALDAPDQTLDAAAGPESRLRAHLDALAIGGPAVSSRLLVPAMSAAEPGQAFAGAAVLAGGGSTGAVLEALAGAPPPAACALQRALELCAPDRALEAIRQAAAEGAPQARAAALRILAFRGVDVGEPLRRAAGASEPEVLAAALAASRHSADPWVRGFVISALASSDVAVRDEALETGVLIGLAPAWEASVRIASSGPAPDRALLLLSLGGDAGEIDAVVGGARAGAARKAALFALGFSGRIAATDACVDAMGDPALGPVAGEAFAAITGIPIEGPLAAEAEPEPDEPIPFDEEDLAADLVPAPEQALPVPDLAAVWARWEAERPRFDPSVRYLAGLPFAPESIAAALEHGPMRRRHGLALELCVRSGRTVDLRTRGWASVQRLAQARIASIPGAQLARAFREICRER